MKASASKQAPTTPDSQEKPTRKPALSIVPQAKESRRSGAREIFDIIERMDVYCPESPLYPSDISKLYRLANSYAQLAIELGERQGKYVQYSQHVIAQLALLRKCIQASKSGTLNLSPREMKRCAAIFAVKLFKDIHAWAEREIDAGGAAMDGAD